MTVFENKLKALFKRKKELKALQKKRAADFAAAGAGVASKQAEVTQAEKEVEDAAV